MNRYVLRLDACGMGDSPDPAAIHRAIERLPASVDRAALSWADPRDDAMTVASGPHRAPLLALKRHLRRHGVRVVFVRALDPSPSDEVPPLAPELGREWREHRPLALLALGATTVIVAALLGLSRLWLLPVAVEVDAGSRLFPQAGVFEGGSTGPSSLTAPTEGKTASARVARADHPWLRPPGTARFPR